MNRPRRPTRWLLTAAAIALLPALGGSAAHLWRTRCAGCGWPRWPAPRPIAEDGRRGLAALDGPIHPTEACYEAWVGGAEAAYLDIIALDDLLPQYVGSGCPTNWVKRPGRVEEDDLVERLEAAIPPHVLAGDVFSIEIHRGQLIVMARRPEHEEIVRTLDDVRDRVTRAD